MFKFGGEIYFVGDYTNNEDDFLEFKRNWESRDKRDLETFPIHEFETKLYETGIIPKERHFSTTLSSGANENKYNYVGPGTHFIARYQGSDTYRATRTDEAPLVGRSPYDLPIDDIDWCACIHDLVYTNPLSSPDDITSADRMLRGCWDKYSGESKYQKILTKSSGAAFKSKNFFEQRLGKEGTFSSAKKRDKDETPELNMLEKLRGEGRALLQGIITRPGRDPKRPITFNLPESMQVDLSHIGEILDVPVLELFKLYGGDIIAFSQLLRILFYVYDHNKAPLIERENIAKRSLKSGKDIKMPLLSRHSGGGLNNKNKKRKKIKKRRTRKRMKTKKRNTKKRKKSL